MKQFSDRLISLRKERGLTQEDVAKLIDKKRSTVSGYEIEGKEPEFELVCLLARYFDVSTDYLLGYSEERKRVDIVLYNDRIDFKKRLDSAPENIHDAIGKCFDSLYRLLCYDTELARPERLFVYYELLQTLQSRRAEIRAAIESSGGAISDPVALSDLMAMQGQLKNEISSLLDKLMQADMEIAFNIKQDGRNATSARSAG